MSYLCLHVPDFAVQALLRTGVGSYQRDAFALVDGPDSVMRVVSCTPLARSLGVELGLAKNALGIFPGVKVQKRVLDQEQNAQSALVDIGLSLSPRVESTSAGTILIDLRGSHRLYGAPETITETVIDRANSTGMFLHVGFAPNADTALCIARAVPGPSIIKEGDESRRLAAIPITALCQDDFLVEALRNWGISKCGQLAQLPVRDVVQRLGPAGLHVRKLATGKVKRELVCVAESELFTETLDLEEPIEALESLCAALDHLVNAVVTRLLMRALATDEIVLTLDLEKPQDRQLKQNQISREPNSKHQSRLKLPVPTQDAHVLLELLRLQFQKAPPPGAVRRIAIEATAARLRLPQMGLFEPNAPEAAKLEVTVARVLEVVGHTDSQGRMRAGFPSLLDTHTPDQFIVTSQPAGSVPPSRQPESLSLLRFRPPLPAKVTLDDGVIRELKSGNTRHVVVRCWGPWHAGGNWWSRSFEWQREEWDLEIAGREQSKWCRVYRDPKSHAWFIDGVYD